MISCEKSGELVSKKKDQKLSFSENFKLKFHLLICGACALFEVETDVISDCMKHNHEHIPSLSQKKKEEIKKIIDTQ